MKPKATSNAVAETETEGNLSADLGSTAQKAENVLNKAKSVQSKLNNITSKARESRAISKEAQADRLEEETTKTEQLAKEAGFKNATTDKDIPAAIRQQTKAKYAKMGKLRDEAKSLRRQNEAEANEEEQTSLNDAKPVSSQGNSHVPKPNEDDNATSDADALGKSQIKSEAPNNTPKPKGKGKGDEEEEDADADADGVIDSTVGDDVGEGVLEALGGALDDTGILAPIGLLLGAVGIGLGADKKGQPAQITSRDNENSYSFQAGIN